MVLLKNYVFANEAESEEDFVTTPLRNGGGPGTLVGDSLTVEIWGEFSGEFVFEGKTDVNNEDFTPLLAMNLTTKDLATTASAPGIYMIVGAEGIQEFRVRPESFDGGYVTVLARNVATGA